MAKGISILIKTGLDAAGIKATKEEVARMTAKVKAELGGVKQAGKSSFMGWANMGGLVATVKAGLQAVTGLVRGAVKGIRAALSSAFRFETQTRQFGVLIGDIDAAKRHMADLKALGDTPPFSLDEFARASRSLIVMSEGVLGYKKSLELVGDAAAATGVPIEQMGRAVGRAFAFIRDGAPITTATEQLRSMGVVTPEVVEQLKEMQKAGSSSVEMWAKVEEQLKRYSGAMAATETTGQGLMGAISSRWDNAVRAFGMAFQDAAKDGMGQLLDAMKKLEQDGSLQRWAKASADALTTVISEGRIFTGWLTSFYADIRKGAKEAGAILGGFLTGGMAGAKEAALQNSYDDYLSSLEEATQAEDEWRQRDREWWAEFNASIESEAEEVARACDEEERLRDALAEADRKREEKRREELEKTRKEALDALAAENRAAAEATEGPASQSSLETDLLAARTAAAKAEAELAAAADADAVKAAKDKALAAVKAQREAQAQLKKLAQDAIRKEAKEREDAAKTAHEKRVEQLKAEIELAKLEADRWDEAAKKADGKRFEEFDRDERNAEREAKRKEKADRQDVERAQREMDAINRRRRHSGEFGNKADEERFSRLEDFMKKRTGKNEAREREDAKRQELEAAEKQFRDDVASIRKTLEDKVAL